MTFFFSHRPQILNFPPILPLLVHFLPIGKHSHFPPVFRKFNSFLHTFCVFFPPTLAMMHLCITQCTYWTPLLAQPGNALLFPDQWTQHAEQRGSWMTSE